MEGRVIVMGALSLSAILVFLLFAWLAHWASGKFGPLARAA